MFKAVAAAEPVKAAVSAISTLVDEAHFEADSSGVRFRGMDPSHVALIDLSWPAAAFEAYECDSKVKIGARIDEFSKLMKRADRGDSVELSVEESMMGIKTGRKKYRMRLLEAEGTETPLPSTEYSCSVSLDQAKFERAVGDVQVVAEYLTVKSDGGKAAFSGAGDSGECEVLLEGAEVSGSGEGTYSLEYLAPVVKAVGGASSRTKCEFSTAKPLKVSFDVKGMGELAFYLAPRVG